MDIVLNATFNNPSLPVIVRPGFTDSFDREASDTLGTTDDGKAWSPVDLGSNPSVWGPNGDGTASLKTASSTWQLARVDGLSSDGTLTGVLGTFTGTRWGGLAFRIQDAENHIRVAESSGSSSGIALQHRNNGNTDTLGSSARGVEAKDGDAISVQFAGDQISVFLNGVSIIEATLAELVDVPYHGLYSHLSADTSWESISFAPA